MMSAGFFKGAIAATIAAVLGGGAGYELATLRAAEESMPPVPTPRLEELTKGPCTADAETQTFATAVVRRVHGGLGARGADVRIEIDRARACRFRFAVGDDSYLQGVGVVRQEEQKRVQVLLFSGLDASLIKGDRATATVTIAFDGATTYVYDGWRTRFFVGQGRDASTLREIAPVERR